jgi:Mor family transcriptional regulator
MSRERLTMDATRAKIAAAISRKMGLNDSIAKPISEAVLDGLREDFPGQTIYIPARSREERNRQLRSEFNGRNHKELGKKYGVSQPQLYRILKKEAT